MLAVDISNYTGLLQEGVLDKWYDRGVRLIIVQAIDPPPGYPPRVDAEQCDAIVADGRFALAIYGFHWTGTGLLKKNVQRLADEDYPVYFYSGDFEDGTTQASPFARAQEVRNIMEWLTQFKAARPPLAYTGEWWTDEYLPPGTNCMEGYDQWLSFYDHVEAINVQPVAGSTHVAIKQHWGTLTFEGQPNCDLDVLSEEDAADVEAYLAELHGEPAPAPLPVEEPTSPTPTPTTEDTERETPAEWPWPTWREAAINFKGISDELGRQMAAMKCSMQPKGKE